jgi:uncharacterized protein
MNNKKFESMKKKVTAVLKEKEIKRAGIFGSFARGEDTLKSDIDILIELDEKFSLLDLVGIKLELEKILKREIDIVEYKTIKPELKKQILSEEIKIIF